MIIISRVIVEPKLLCFKIALNNILYEIDIYHIFFFEYISYIFNYIILLLGVMPICYKAIEEILLRERQCILNYVHSYG